MPSKSLSASAFHISSASTMVPFWGARSHNVDGRNVRHERVARAREEHARGAAVPEA